MQDGKLVNHADSHENRSDRQQNDNGGEATVGGSAAAFGIEGAWNGRLLGAPFMLSKIWGELAIWWARWRAQEMSADARAEPPETGIGAEAPIRKKSEDRLRRADFADRIANVLLELSPREGRVFAIRGGWGFGKSSLKNLIAERLDAKKGADWRCVIEQVIHWRSNVEIRRVQDGCHST